MGRCSGTLFGYDWDRSMIMALPYSTDYNGFCSMVDVHPMVGSSPDNDAWCHSIEGYNALQALGWPQEYLCQISYYANLEPCSAAPTCEESHPIPECINNHLWACEAGEFVDTGQSCSSNLTCMEQHPYPVCINGVIWQCVNSQFVPTDQECTMDNTTLLLIGGVAAAAVIIGAVVMTRGKK